MSKRRSAGDWVWLRSGAGFTDESNRLKVEILANTEENNRLMKYFGAPCMLFCGDNECIEFTEVLTEPDPEYDNKRHILYHVSECQMFDEQQNEDK